MKLKNTFKKINASMTLAEKIVFFFTLVTLIGTLAFVVAQMIIAPSESAKAHEKVKADYALTLLQCVLGIIVLHLPVFLEYRFSLEVPSVMTIMYVIFLYCAIYLGEFQSFYFRVPHWDIILHTFSGAMTGALSFSVICYLTKSTGAKLNPALVAIFAFCFAVTVGVLWEFYEYAVDAIADLNMQKYADEAGVAFAGKAAVADTMEDLLVDAVGAFVMSVIGYVSVKFDKTWLNKLLIVKKQPEEPFAATLLDAEVAVTDAEVIAADETPLPDDSGEKTN